MSGPKLSPEVVTAPVAIAKQLSAAECDIGAVRPKRPTHSLPCETSAW
jgi:hypothetical protein